MASTVASDVPAVRQRREDEVSLLRLYLLRANYLLWAAAGLFMALPPLFNHDSAARGMIDSMFGGLWVMGILGLRYPLQMLPIFLFEFVWKTIWLLAYGLPQWMAGIGSPRLSEDLVSIGNGPILFGLIIPWGYVWRHYIKQPSERWRRRPVAVSGPQMSRMGTPVAPRLQTPRLTLRGWQPDDFAPYAELLSDPGSARFITRGGQAYGKPQAWAEMAFLVGHWQMLGYGMFVVEDRATGAFLGRVGPLHPPGWPGFEIAWAIIPQARGRGYATEAATAAIKWSFESLGVERIISIIHPGNHASQRVAERIGERRTGQQFAPLGEPCDVWEMNR